VFPGAGYLEMAAAAVLFAASGSHSNGSGTGQPALAAIALAMPCLLPELPAQAGGLHLTCCLQADSGAVSINSQTAAGPSSVASRHMEARVVTVASMAAGLAPAAAAAAGPQQHLVQSMEVARAACSMPLSPSGVYRALSEAGLQYGAQFQRLQAVSAAADGNSSMGAIRGDSGASGYSVHPAVLDSVLQLGAVVAEPNQQQKGPLVPAALQLYGPLAGPAHGPAEAAQVVHGVAHRPAATPTHSADETHRDHALLSSTGALISLVHDLVARPAGRQAVQVGNGACRV